MRNASKDQATIKMFSKQMIWDMALDNGSDFTNADASLSTTYTEGEWYHIVDSTRVYDEGNSGDVRDVRSQYEGYFRAELTVTTTLNNNAWYRGGDGNFYAASGDLRLTAWAGNGFGDNNQIEVLSGKQLLTDLNGNEVIHSHSKLAIPEGWVKNNE